VNKLKAICFAALIAPSAANAASCAVNFNYGVIIDPTHIRIIEGNQTKVQINGLEQIFVNGREVKLTEQQRVLVKDYASGIRQQVPEIVSIAIEGLEMGLKAVNKVIAGITGENSATHQKLQKRFDELQWRLRKRFNHTDNNYYIAPQDFDDFGEIFAGEFEQEIEQIVTKSIGTLLMAVGDAVANQEDESSEQRISNYSERVEAIGKDLKLDLINDADVLESKAELFCEQLKALDEIENELHLSLEELTPYNLIQVQ